MKRVPDGLALIALLGLSALLVYLAGSPHQSDDFWFHLAMGETFATQGPWPGSDPILFTAHEGNPVPHEWLFDVVLHGLDRLVGLQGLRVVHALAVALTLLLAFSVFRREGGLVGAALASSAFGVLSWWRIIQLRPDLFTVPATLLLFRLLLEEDRAPSWRRVAAAALLLGVWANVHSAFSAGLLILLAGLLGVGVRAWAARLWIVGEERRAELANDANRARRLGAALALGLGATLLNPRGVGQHLTYLHMREAAIMPGLDDWAPFHPFRPLATGAVGGLETIVLDGVLLLFAAAAGVGLVRFLRQPSRESLDAVDPVRFGCGLAAAIAPFVAIRFTWLGAFPLLFALRGLRGAPVAARTRSISRWVASAATAMLLVAFLADGRYARFAVINPAAYRSQAYAVNKYHPEAVGFLLESGLEGNLFNPYHLGGFLGYWLAPRVRLFVDGRNEAYPPEIVQEMARVQARHGLESGESTLDLLARRGVNLFLGVGMPLGRDAAGVGVYTTPLLDRAPGWIPIFRTVQSAVYLRDDAANRENLARVAAWYRRQGVPFDAERGLDAAEVVRTRPDWAARHGMLTLDGQALLAARSDADPNRRLAALDQLATLFALLGAYEEQVTLDREVIRLAPRAPGPRRRLVWGLLRLDRQDEALAAARDLQRVGAADPRSALFVRAAQRYGQLRDEGQDPLTAGALVDALPLLTEAEIWQLLAGRFAAPPDLQTLRARDGSGT